MKIALSCRKEALKALHWVAQRAAPRCTNGSGAYSLSPSKVGDRWGMGMDRERASKFVALGTRR